ncbi:MULTISPECIES: T3SS regulon anti-activator ExsD domain-containing protein [Aeromonas]|uniref:T3SS regulon anti-activator ExsD domain-containing protein n=1 Tax=Aeromonas TaxID=642 RepID=UPI001CC7CDB8|nr:T3SS regulon anti-activator ExsD domain-containing protein [Aeromonas schubertii]MBZ6074326.1 T3SS regulon anti-activator ExsD family protein [Aeromonas schubertii]
MSHNEHNPADGGPLAGRRVTLIPPDSLSRDVLVGVLHPSGEARLLTHEQHALLQRLLPRARLESLLASRWYRRRLPLGRAVSRSELVWLARCGRGESPWDQVLGERIHIGQPCDCWPLLLQPLYAWWMTQLEPDYEAWLQEREQLSVMVRQWQAQRAFWQQVQAEPGQQASLLARIASQQADGEARMAQLERRLDELALRAKQLWPAWEPARAGQAELAALQPVPAQLAPLWEWLLSPLTEPLEQAHAWLLARGICLMQDRIVRT